MVCLTTIDAGVRVLAATHQAPEALRHDVQVAERHAQQFIKGPHEGIEDGRHATGKRKGATAAAAAARQGVAGVAVAAAPGAPLGAGASITSHAPQRDVSRGACGVAHKQDACRLGRMQINRVPIVTLRVCACHV